MVRVTVVVVTPIAVPSTTEIESDDLSRTLYPSG